MNQSRSQAGLPPYTLDLTQTTGVGTCVGSVGHSLAMQASGYIWHVNASYPLASFPTNNCEYPIQTFSIGQNAGWSSSGNTQYDLSTIHASMMAEPHDPAFCATTDNHACNILSPTFTRVGIGLAFGNGTWLTCDFMK